mmetsp:Transcript_46079/g.128070  ORF Transcript_46079/g.128070 Transcript_46079/m.128070 type:complete len:214 (+) Transcript_46079:697-1338(+)
MLQRGVRRAVNLDGRSKAMGERLLFGVVKGGHFLGIRKVHRAFGQIVFGLDDDLDFFAIVGEFVIMFHLAAMRREGLRVVAYCSAATTLDPFGAPLAGSLRGCSDVLPGQIYCSALEGLIALREAPLLLGRHGVNARHANNGIVVLPGVKQVDAAGALRVVGTIAQDPHGFTTNDRDLEAVVLGENHDLVLTAPMGVVLDPDRVLFRAVHSEE